MMMQNLKNKGVNVQEFRQNGRNYTDIVNSFELAVQTDKIAFVDNDCFKWNLYNVQIESFNDGRLMPYKRGDENKKIDVAIACLMAYKGVITKPEEEKKNSAEAYLIAKGDWTEEEDVKLIEEVNTEIGETFKKVEGYGANVELIEIFEHTYAEMTPQLKEQYEEHKKFLEGAK